jgi:hypothetical protein
VNDDDLLARLRKAASHDAERARAPEWERVADGTATDEERRALEKIARAWDDEDALRDLAPIAPSARDAMVDRVLGAAAAERATQSQTARAAGNVVPLRRTRVVAIAAALAVAAAALVAVNFGRGRDDALPAYALAVGGGIADDRAGDPAHPDAVLRVGRDSRLDIVLRPERDTRDNIAIAAAIVRGSTAEAWNPPRTISPTGAVRISGDASSLVPGGNGPLDLVITVGREGALPTSAQAIAQQASDSRVRVFRVHLLVEGR